MSDPALEFTRIVLGFDQGTPDRTALRLAADLAKLLRLSLFGLFAQDPRLTNLAEIPLMREFRVLERQWRPIERASLLDNLELSVSIARKAFDDVTQAFGVPLRFEVMQATTMEAIASVSIATDIIMLTEPRTPADRAFQPFSEIVAAAMTTPASVLVVPSHIARQHGAILAIVESPDDPSVASAAAIASATSERMQVIVARDLASLSRPRLPARPGERMIVMTRSISGKLTPLSIASWRRVPVLVLGHGRVTKTETSENAAPETHSIA